MLIFILSNNILNLEVNECEKNIHNCDIHATCGDTIGSFTCTCNIGFEGDGVNCDGKRIFVLL